MCLHINRLGHVELYMIAIKSFQIGLSIRKLFHCSKILDVWENSKKIGKEGDGAGAGDAES